MFDYLANPTRFMRLADLLIVPMAALAALLLAAGLYLGLLASPPDYQQGDTVRIMYVHVPAAWLATLGYVALGLCGLFYIVWRHPLADIALRAMAPVGALFAFLTLVTGALWGKPMWGAWWVWDARLTSMLILFFFYIAVIALANAFDTPERGSRPAAILALVGLVNVPIVKFSVDWWNTLHQPASLVRSGGVSIDPAMLTPLLLMLAGTHLFLAGCQRHPPAPPGQPMSASSCPSTGESRHGAPPWQAGSPAHHSGSRRHCPIRGRKRSGHRPQCAGCAPPPRRQ